MSEPVRPPPSPARRAAASRAALIAAARTLYASGKPPSVTEAARAAGLSRATAYRQFPSPELLAEAAVTDPECAPIPDILAGLTAPHDRALAVCDWRLAFAARLAPQLRRHLALREQARLRRDPTPAPPRPSPRAEAAFRAALAPARDRLPPAVFDDLLSALVALTGFEALAALTERGVPPETAARAARRAARALLDAALRQTGQACDAKGRASCPTRGPRPRP